ncbi:MAG: aromatic hydrocarbon degradation protein [Leptospiraceae bacterium]|nr:aromatic hydrocarbon degradation protein [Leptospiraceae bacterium]
MKIFLSVVFLIYISNLEAGDYGDLYGAHPAANGVGNAVTATVNDSSSVFYNVAGLGKQNEADKIFAKMEIQAKDALDPNANPPPPPINKNFRKKFQDFLRDSWTEIKTDNFKNIPAYRSEKTPHELVLQYNIARPRLNTSAPTNQDLERTRDDYTGLNLGLNLNSIYNLKRNFRFGLNVILPASGNLLAVNDVNPNAHRYLMHGASNQKPIIMGGLGIEVIKDILYAGVGFTALASGSGSILLKDVPISPDRVAPNQQVILEVKPMINPTYGLAFQYGKFLGGVSYRREVALDINSLPARAQTTLLGIQLDFDVSLFDLFTPRKWSYGIGYKPTKKLTLMASIDRELWSAYRLSRTKATYNQRVYFDDITIPRAGIEYAFTDWLKLRAGLARRPRPTPVMADTWSTDFKNLFTAGDRWNLMDFDRMIYTGGISLIAPPGLYGYLPNLKSPIIIDLVVEYQKLHGEHVYKANPTPTNPNYSAGGNVIHFGISFTAYL